MNVQIIEKNGKPEWAVIPFNEYQKLIETMSYTKMMWQLSKWQS